MLRAGAALVVAILLLCSSASSDAKTLPPGTSVNFTTVTIKPCDNIVTCFVSPCSTLLCRPPPQYKCVANNCGTCNATWVHNTTGLVLSTCPPSACARVKAPVCGTDGVTYPNECAATLSGYKVAYTGNCKCPRTRSPVCGSDGVTYTNACKALANGTTINYTGTCPYPTACVRYSKVYKPVCDEDKGRTWANVCIARLNGVTNYKDGPCLGGACARCSQTAGCRALHKCRGDPKYKCGTAYCSVKHVLDSGARVTYGVCRAVYFNRATGYPAAACYR